MAAILVWPERIQSPSINEIPCVTSDYFPTILDALGIELPERPFDGVSLMPVIRGELWTRNEPICFQSKNVATIQMERYKLVSTGSNKDNTVNASSELFDLTVDPGETQYLALSDPGQVMPLR